MDVYMDEWINGCKDFYGMKENGGLLRGKN